MIFSNLDIEDGRGQEVIHFPSLSA